MSLPNDVARCQPLACKQSPTCARANDWPDDEDAQLSVIDASVSLTSSQEWCPMFIDMRGANLVSHSEPAAMPRNYQSIDTRLQQVAALLKPAGITRAAISEAIGIAAKSAMFRIMAIAVERGVAFETFARVSDTMKTPEMVYFPVAADRDAFRVAYEADKVARTKARHAAKARQYYETNRERLAAERIAQRAAATERRKAKDAAADPQHLALRAAEREIAALKKRQYREAKAAEVKREKREAASQQKRLKAETRAAGRLKKRPGTDTAKVAAPRGPAMLPGELDLSRAKVTIAPPMPDRWAAISAPSVVSSRECSKWAEAVAA